MTTQTQHAGPDERAAAVPLIERLRSVPVDAKLQIHTPNPLGVDTQNIAIGRICQEAAALLAEDKGGEETYANN